MNYYVEFKIRNFKSRIRNSSTKVQNSSNFICKEK